MKWFSPSFTIPILFPLYYYLWVLSLLSIDGEGGFRPMLEKIKIFILIILPIVILGILSALRSRNIISPVVLSSIAALIAVVLPSGVGTYFSKKFLKNFEKNEKYVAALIFVHPKIKKSFKIFFIACFIFGIAWTFSIMRRFIEVISEFGSFMVGFSTYLVILSLIYFFKTLYEITKSD